MKFFADTADIADIRALADSGLLDGVGERGIHGDGDRIAPFGAGEGQRQLRAAPFNQNMLAHGASPSNRVTFMGLAARAVQICAKP